MIEAMKLALQALENKFLFVAGDGEAIDLRAKAITSLRKAIAEAEKQEPVAEVKRNLSGQIYIQWRESVFAMANLVGEKFYTSLPQRHPLTDEQKVALCKQFPENLTFNSINAVEAALRSKNT